MRSWSNACLFGPYKLVHAHIGSCLNLIEKHYKTTHHRLGHSLLKLPPDIYLHITVHGTLTGHVPLQPVLTHQVQQHLTLVAGRHIGD